MKKYTFLLPLIFNALCPFSFGQQTDKGTLMSDSAGIIQREMASFTIAGKRRLPESNAKAIPVNEIRLWHCGDDELLFDNAGFFSPDIMVRISIGPGKECLERRIREIVIVRDTKRQFPLPDSAFTDLKVPAFCADVQGKGGRKKLTNCRAFFSKDKKRIYVYMHSCTGSHISEVTWVVQHGRYVTRTINEVQ
jgi:hypothetical protein